MKSTALFLLGLVCLLTSCQSDPYAGDYLTEKPEAAKCVGTYELDYQTVTNEATKLSSFVILRADGTCTVHQIPLSDDVNQDGAILARLHSGEGHWRIETAGAVDYGWYEKEYWGIDLDIGMASHPFANITRQGNHFGLLFDIGDPDAGTALILKWKKTD